MKDESCLILEKPRRLIAGVLPIAIRWCLLDSPRW